MRAPKVVHVIGWMTAVGCGASGGRAAPPTDGGPPSEGAATVGADAAGEVDAGLDAAPAGQSQPDATGLPPDAASDVDGTNTPMIDGSTMRMDGAVVADAALAVPPFTDPFDGASGCPDGGYPLGRGPCAAAFPLSGDPSVNGVFQPGACDNNNDGYESVWFASDYGYGQNTTNVHVDFSTPLAGMIGTQPVTVSIDVPDGDFNRLTWSTAPGACTVTLHTDVCWDFEQVQYYLVDGTGHCISPAVSAGDAGGSLNVGDFWFQTISYP